MEMINKKELVKEVATALDHTQKDVSDILEGVIDAISANLEKGIAVKVSGLVTFETQEVNERTARNPQTGEAIVVPAHNRVKVKISKTLKDKVR